MPKKTHPRPVKCHVTRVITIILQPESGGAYSFHITPEYAEANTGDIVDWVIAGAPADALIKVADFELVDGAPRVGFKRDRPMAQSTFIPDKKFTKTKTGWRLNTKGVEPGVFKYDVYWNDELVVDPELEIKGPRGTNG
jgi:hypothetical protein